MAERFVLPFAREFDSNADPLAGGELFFFVSGTTTPADTYSDAGRTTPNSNPVVSDADGRWPSIWLGDNSYKVVLVNADGETVWTADPVAGSAASGFASQTDVNERTSTEKAVTPATLAHGLGIQGPSIASAATLTLPDVGTAFPVTGTTTIAGISERREGAEVTLTFAGALTLTHDASTFALLGSADITTATGDIATFRATADGWEMTNYVQANGLPVGASAFAKTLLDDADASAARTTLGIKGVAQVAAVETGAVATGTTQMPADDTKPQNTEGDQYMSLSITPKNANSTLIIDVVWNGATSATTGTFTAALFQDSAADALAAAPSQISSTAGSLMQVKIRHKMTAGSTSAMTFKVRAGSSGAGTTTFNGSAGGRFYGGVMASSIVITEILP